MSKNWQKGLVFSIIFVILLSLVGCALFRNPTASWDKATQKVEQVQNKIDTNKDNQTEVARQYVYSTHLALRADPSTNVAHDVAVDFNDKAVATLGTPEMAEIIQLRAMVNNLLSTNKALVVRGEKQAQALDQQLIELQTENGALMMKLDKAEKKVIEVGTTNAGYASKWTSLVKIFWWIVYGFIAVFVIKILSAVLPPPYNSIVSIVAVPIGLVVKAIHGIFPEAKAAAGVVAVKTYDNTKLALEHIITAIEEAKRDKPEVVAQVVPYLKNETSVEVTRPLITDVKRELGYV